MGEFVIMDLEIRRERPEDYHETEHVTREAFWNHYSPGCSEHYLLHLMRDCPAFVSELDFVALAESQIVGNVVSMKTIIEGDDGRQYDVLALGPISVLPEYQGRGIGGRLIEHTRQAARQLSREGNFRAILLYGDPDYYTRQGFIPAERLGIRTADNMYAAAHLVCELYENALSEARGRYVEDTIYEVDESAAAEFDKGFPPKEKISGTPSQKRFETLVALRKNAIY